MSQILTSELRQTLTLTTQSADLLIFTYINDMESCWGTRATGHCPVVMPTNQWQQEVEVKMKNGDEEKVDIIVVSVQL